MLTLTHVGHKITWRLRQTNQVLSQDIDNLKDAMTLVKILSNAEKQTGTNKHGQPVFSIVYRGEADYFNLSPIWKMQ